jgi:hypothetical protein
MMVTMRAVLACCLLVAACSVGDGGGGGGGGSGGGGGDASTDGSGGPVWVDAAPGQGGMTECKDPVTGYGDGHHNTGRNCMDGCHNHGFTIAGTLYTNPTNNSGYAGATITLKDSANRTIDVVVQADGNFYTSQAVSFPAIVMASSCPYGVKMTASVANGACNTAACHAQQNGAAGQIHLP